MNYYNIKGTLVMPSTENMAYEQTNHRIDDLEINIHSDVTDTQRIINENETAIDNRITDEIDTINSRISAEISTIGSRVDNIIAHNNNTEGNSELLDIRTGIDGVNYNSAGAAVRGQISSAVICANHRVTAADDEYYNADNVPSGKIVAYIIGENIPYPRGTLCCFEGTTVNGRTQIYIDYYAKIYSRYCWSNQWTSWRVSDPTTIDTVRNANGFVSMSKINDTNTFSDANLLPANTAFVIACQGFDNLPPDLHYYGTILTFYKNLNEVPVSGCIQIFVDITGKYATRIKWSETWSNWKILPDQSSVENLINRKIDDFALTLSSSPYYCSFSLFETIGVVGDSYASGAYGENSSATIAVDHMNYSWPQMLARRNGCSVTNYTKGGISTRTFITNTNIGLSALLIDTPKQMYILALERNDYNIENRGESGYLGSITDITNHSLGSYPDTFYGNYATIIENIINHAPSAKIVMMTGDYKSDNILGTSYNNAVEEIAGHYNLPCMIQLEEPFFNSNYYRTQWARGGHPSAIIYSGMELAIERMFDKCVRNNKNYFTYL